jgi:hypothetical protein
MAWNVADGMWEMLVAAGQVLTGKMDDIIETVEHNVRLL